MNLKSHITTSHFAKASEKALCDGVVAVYVKGHAESGLDSEHGADILLDITDREAKSITAVYRYSEFWCEPCFPDRLSRIPDETQMLIIGHEEGDYTLILPVVSEKYRCVMYGDYMGVHAKLFTYLDGVKDCDCLAFTYIRTNDPYKAAEKCFMLSLKELGRDLLPRKERVYPEMFEYLGWCSWDALQIRVNEKDLVEKCREFKEKRSHSGKKK